MTNEGTFPKVPGDIAYSSEANMFNPKIVGNWNQYNSAVGRSGTSPTTVGAIGSTINYNAASGICYKFFKLEGTVDAQYSAGDIVSKSQFWISGPGVNMAVTPIKTLNGRANFHIMNTVLTSGTLTASGGNVGSNYDFTILACNNNNATNVSVSDFVVWGH